LLHRKACRLGIQPTVVRAQRNQSLDHLRVRNDSQDGVRFFPGDSSVHCQRRPWSRGPKATAGDWLAPIFGRASDYPPLVCHPDVGAAIMWEHFLAPLDPGTYTLTETDSLRHPVTDGYHQCWYEGERLSAPPSLYRGVTVSTVTITVGD
jgi:hypothetical protein